jgi:exonuclease SbcD
VDLAGRARTSWVELTQPRGMAELTGTLAELLALTGHEQDWLRVVVTDPVRPDRLLERITARFPFVLQVFHDPAGASPARASAGAESGLVRSPVQLCRQFVEQVTGFPPSADECTLFERAYETALAAAAADTGLSR